MPHGAASALGWPARTRPAVASVTLNPMMGYLRAAYAARIDDELLLCTRYDFNVYSYLSDWAVGVEYKLRRMGDEESMDVPASTMRERVGVWVAPHGNAASLRETPAAVDDKPASANDRGMDAVEPGALGSSTRMGLLKARLSASGLFSLLWEGYWRRCLVSVGLRTQLPTPAGSTLGVEIMYLART